MGLRAQEGYDLGEYLTNLPALHLLGVKPGNVLGGSIDVGDLQEVVPG